MFFLSRTGRGFSPSSRLISVTAVALGILSHRSGGYFMPGINETNSAPF
jgi:hypothetical protein